MAENSDKIAIFHGFSHPIHADALVEAPDDALVEPNVNQGAQNALLCGHLAGLHSSADNVQRVGGDLA